MRLKSLDSKVYYCICCAVLMLISASISFNGYYQKWHFGEQDMPGDHIRASFEQMVDGTAYRPYVYRRLVPSIANWMNAITPQSTKDWLLVRQGSGEDAFIYAIANSPTANNSSYFFRYLIVYIVTFLFALLAVFAMYLVCTAYDFHSPTAVLAAVVVILLLPYIMSNGGFFYDYSELALISLAVWMARKFNWWWLIPLAALGAWNKESFLLFIFTLYPIIRSHRSRRSAVCGVAVLSIVALLIYSFLRIRFAHNPGGIVEVQWIEQLRIFTHPRTLLFATEETYGVYLVKIFTILPMTILIWTFCRGWKHLPHAIQRHGQIAAALNIPLYLLFCFPGELRDLSMLYITFLLVIAVNLKQWIEGAGQTQSQIAKSDASLLD